MILTIEELQKFLKDNKDIAYCKILKNLGSSPREKGAWMLISKQGKIFGTIGGGQLEYNLIQSVMRQDWKVDFNLEIETTLGPDIAQCCGGKVIISILKMNYTFSKHLSEKFKKDISKLTQVLIFGAGNVGTSLALQMYNLPFKIKLIDNRENFISKLNLPIEKKRVSSADYPLPLEMKGINDVSEYRRHIGNIVKNIGKEKIGNFFINRSWLRKP